MQQDQTTSSLPSSSERSSSSAPQTEEAREEGMESDEEIGRVPEVGLELATGPSTSGRETGAAAAAAGTSSDRGQSSSAVAQAASAARRSPADKEHRRLKRLLRNRVSAQQARERKKAYLSELEVRVKDLERRNSELEERLSTLQNENQMLRQILKNTTVNRRGPGMVAAVPAETANSKAGLYMQDRNRLHFGRKIAAEQLFIKKTLWNWSAI